MREVDIEGVENIWYFDILEEIDFSDGTDGDSLFGNVFEVFDGTELVCEFVFGFVDNAVGSLSDDLEF